MTLQTQLVLRDLLAEPDAERYGLAVVDGTGLPPGTIYPILTRLETAGWVTSRWEDVDPRAEGRPRRRFYRLTADGARQARTALARVEERRRRPGRASVVRSAGAEA
ncbi:PadR family transcriptional regulator [Cryptosporangium aurantiacum]|uniref:Transcriptional regulator PadR-like family protein n=1 Tax=Cryptosporangium aurantiacum TaxID=134849 RepID=A0A1M7PBM9_9ACTN|nr:helix-turn-helix transcriptional regulator [Cryptosporangium aurantiacum]SHN14261.1 Transcriptional regulator PadR-like family protein [Cryptosporangium aurantiacum]